MVELTANKDARTFVWTVRNDDCTYVLHLDPARGKRITRTIDRRAGNDNKQNPQKGEVIVLQEGVTYTIWLQADLHHNASYGRWVTLDGKATWNLHENKLDIDWPASPVHGSVRFEVQ